MSWPTAKLSAASIRPSPRQSAPLAGWPTKRPRPQRSRRLRDQRKPARPIVAVARQQPHPGGVAPHHHAEAVEPPCKTVLALEEDRYVHGRTKLAVGHHRDELVPQLEISLRIKVQRRATFVFV